MDGRVRVRPGVCCESPHCHRQTAQTEEPREELQEKSWQSQRTHRCMHACVRHPWLDLWAHSQCARTPAALRHLCAARASVSRGTPSMRSATRLAGAGSSTAALPLASCAGNVSGTGSLAGAHTPGFGASLRGVRGPLQPPLGCHRGGRRRARGCDWAAGSSTLQRPAKLVLWLERVMFKKANRPNP